MAALSLVAALTATFVAWPRTQAPLPAPAPVVVVDAPEAPATPDVIVDEAPEAPVVVADATPVEAPVDARPTRPNRPNRPNRPRPADAHQDLASQLDFGTGDGLIPD